MAVLLMVAAFLLGEQPCVSLWEELLNAKELTAREEVSKHVV